MTPLLPALGGALVVAGILGVILGLRPVPEAAPRPRPKTRPPFVHRLGSVPRTTKLLLAAGAITGALLALLTGWLIAVVLIPAAFVGLPVLLTAPASTARVDKLEALEEWTRGLSGVLTVGVGLEQALIATLRSTPAPIRPEVTTLVARLRARWSTEAALRAFAAELDDATGDLVAANLILGARRRGAGLASVLDALAESVSADVDARRAIEADRNKPRTTARWVTIITVGTLAVLAMTGSYIAPYGTPVGRLLLAGLLAAYIGALVWMRQMTVGDKLPRFLAAPGQGGRR